jgi:sensor histidine kinase YesM
LTAVRFGGLTALIVAAAEFRRHEDRSLETMRAAEAAREVRERQTLQARLKVLEAQIEPHFLFNTLTNVRRLYELDRNAGDAMLGRLMVHLQTTLPSIRAEHSTLEREGDCL